MIQKAKNEVFGHSLEFGLLDRLDIAYCDSTKCFLTFGNKNAFLNDPKSKKVVFGHFLELSLLDRLDIA